MPKARHEKAANGGWLRNRRVRRKGLNPEIEANRRRPSRNGEPSGGCPPGRIGLPRTRSQQERVTGERHYKCRAGLARASRRFFPSAPARPERKKRTGALQSPPPLYSNKQGSGSPALVRTEAKEDRCDTFEMPYRRIESPHGAPGVTDGAKKAGKPASGAAKPSGRSGPTHRTDVRQGRAGRRQGRLHVSWQQRKHTSETCRNKAALVLAYSQRVSETEFHTSNTGPRPGRQAWARSRVCESSPLRGETS